MTIAALQKRTKPGIILVSLLLIAILRWESLIGFIWINASFLEMNHYPVWHSITSDPLLDVEPPETVLLQQALQFNQENTSLWRGWGLILLAQGKEGEAIAAWQGAGLEPAQVVLSQGHYARSVGQHDTSLAWYEYAINLDPTLAAAWHEIGILRMYAGQVEAAKAAYETAFALGYADSANPLATLWRDEGEYQKAIEIWQSALNAFPIHYERLRWWQGLSNSLRAAGQWQEGLRVVELALHEFPEDARLYVEYGALIYGDSGNVDAAMAALNRAMTLDETMVSAYSTAAQVLASERRYTEAYERYGQVIERDPQNSTWYVAQANMARAMGELLLARRAFMEAIVLSPDFAPAHYGIASVYKQLGDKDNATSAITRALQLSNNQNLPYLLRAGEIYEWSGNSAAAVEAYQRAIAIEPDNATATVALQRLLTQSE